MAYFEGERRKFIVRQINRNVQKEDPDIVIGNRAAEIFFDRVIKRPGAAKLMHKLSKR